MIKNNLFSFENTIAELQKCLLDAEDIACSDFSEDDKYGLIFCSDCAALAKDYCPGLMYYYAEVGEENTLMFWDMANNPLTVDAFIAMLSDKLEKLSSGRAFYMKNADLFKKK